MKTSAKPIKTLTVSKLAQSAGVGLETIRFYERKGVLRKPRRTSAGYRIYEESDAMRLRFVKRAQDLGFTLKEISDLLAMNVGEGARCSQMNGPAEAKLAEIERKIEDLQAMRKQLKEFMKVCSSPTGRAPCECQVAECFEEGRCV